MTVRSRKAALAAIVMGGFGAFGIAWASAQDGPTTGTPTVPIPTQSATASSVSDIATQNLRVLRATPAVSATEAAELRGASLSTPTRRFGLNAALARRVGSGIAGHPLYLVPGNGYVCLSGQDIGSSCVDERQLQDPRPQLDVSQCGQIPQGTIALSGIAPDGIGDLAVVRGDAKTAISVRENSFFATAAVGEKDGVPDALEWTDATGKTQSIQLQLPPDTATVTCGPSAH